jgi:beta-galactosidase
MPGGVVVSGGDQGSHMKNPVFGMVAGEARIGKGLVFLSQALATERYGKDPIATRYLHNVLRYTLGREWTGEYAEPLTGERVRFLDRNDCFFVDLGARANRTFSDEKQDDRRGGWTDEGKNDLRGIKRGDVMFRGVPFRILDDKDDRPSCMILGSAARPYLPKAIEGIKVGRKASKLIFLHASARTGPGGRKVAEYRVRYDDGSAESVGLVAGENIGEWWGASDLPEAAVAWKYQNPVGATVGLYQYDWDNPHPKKTIAEIDFVSAETGPLAICVAITGVR